MWALGYSVNPGIEDVVRMGLALGYSVHPGIEDVVRVGGRWVTLLTLG